jgi:4-diphosphocytidyl-2-C-methyl-D-erythritol kinase
MRADAFAKLTLSLHVTGVRADGYHELDAVMVSVTAPHDALSIRKASRTSLHVTGEFATAVPTDASNLAWQAADAAGVPAEIRIAKMIPPGAGLGGGSADAAAVLVALGVDAAVGAQLGADVPFCMRGGAARVRGIGDVIEPIELEPKIVVIATPRFACATAEVYRAWDLLGCPHADVNDLEPAAHHVEPRLVEFKQAVEAAAGAPAILAGSGSSYAVVFDHNADAEQARTRIAEAIDGSVWLGTTTDVGVALNP